MLKFHIDGLNQVHKCWFGIFCDLEHYDSFEKASIEANYRKNELNEDPLFLGELSINEWGRYTITTKDRLNDTETVMIFGDLTSRSEAVKLHRLDETKKYQTRNSLILAENLQQLVLGSQVVLIIDETGTVLHEIVKLEKNFFVDSLGFWTEKALKEYWSKDDNTVELVIQSPTSNNTITEQLTLQNSEVLDYLTLLLKERGYLMGDSVTKT